MSRWVRAATLCACTAVPSAPSWAQPPAALVTDRPDETESAVTVPRGSTQIEFGARWIFDRSADVRLGTVEAPGTLVRLGMWQRVELRLAWGGWVGTELETSRQRHRADGFADPEVGIKWGLRQPGGAGTELAFIAHVSLPAGGEGVGAPGIDPSARLSVAHPLGDRASLGWNLGYEVRSFDDGSGRGIRRPGRWVYSAALGFDLSSRWGTFVEVFGDLSGSDPGPAFHALDGGLTYGVASRVQLDVSVGVGLNDEAPDRFVGIGLSFRMPQ